MTPDPRPESSKKRAPDSQERYNRSLFKERVFLLDDRECLAHDFATDCEGPLQAHHVVTQQQLRAAGRHDLLWTSRNGMTVCELAHTRHTKAILRIPLDRVPDRAKAFAAEFGFEWILDRYYPAG